jgi:hypothetical protein
MKMETVRSSKTSENLYQLALRHITEDTFPFVVTAMRTSNLKLKVQDFTALGVFFVLIITGSANRIDQSFSGL